MPLASLLCAYCRSLVPLEPGPSVHVLRNPIEPVRVEIDKSDPSVHVLRNPIEPVRVEIDKSDKINVGIRERVVTVRSCCL